MTNIVETAQGAENLTTLVKALQAAGLVETLSGPGPFTLFAPADNAFAGMPSGVLDGLLANKDELKGILTYHVVPERLTAQDLASMVTATTLEGNALRIDATGGSVMVNEAIVTQPDLQADNGVIHIVDAVIVPPEA